MVVMSIAGEMMSLLSGSKSKNKSDLTKGFLLISFFYQILQIYMYEPERRETLPGKAGLKGFNKRSHPL